MEDLVLRKDFANGKVWINSQESVAQHAPDTAMGDDHGRTIQRAEPCTDPLGQDLVAFASRRYEAPDIGPAPFENVRIAFDEFLIGKAFPGAVVDFLQSIVEPVVGRIEIERGADDFHGLAGTHERTGDEVELADVGESPGDSVAVPPGLISADIVQWYVAVALEATDRVPIGLTVTQEDDGRMHGSRPTVASVVDLKFVAQFAACPQTNFKSKTTLKSLAC